MENVRLDPVTRMNVLDLIRRDLRCASDDGDLSRRLACNGYGFRDTARGRVLVTLPHGVELMPLPQDAVVGAFH